MKLTFSCEELLKTEVNEFSLVGYLCQLVEDIKLFQVNYKSLLTFVAELQFNSHS